MPHLLFVCVANRARSPLAELTTRALLSQYDGETSLSVGSAGTWTPGDEPMWEPAAEAARELGLEPQPFRSRRLTPELVDDCDVLLGATRQIRDHVVAMRPTALSKSFTWRELAAVFAAVVPDWGDLALDERPALIPGFVRHYRAHVGLAQDDRLDVVDPAGREPQVMADAATATVASVRTIVAALCR